MIQGYILYVEALNKSGEVIMNGNHTITSHYEGYNDPDKFLSDAVKYLTNRFQSTNSQVTRVVIKGLFKL